MGGGNVEALGRSPSTRKTGDQEVWRGTSNITVESLDEVPVEEQRVELVERKGVGHHDSICDAIMEDISVALCGEYMSTFGHIVHHNIDKGLLVAGMTSPKIGGGTVDEPMKLVFGGRRVRSADGDRGDGLDSLHGRRDLQVGPGNSRGLCMVVQSDRTIHRGATDRLGSTHPEGQCQLGLDPKER